MTLDTVWTTLKEIGLFLGLFASIITIGGFLSWLWLRSRRNDQAEEVAPPPQSPSLQTDLAPEVLRRTPADLKSMLRSANAIPSPSVRDTGLRTVAEAAVHRKDYAIAIEAGAASSYPSSGSETLSFVALSAAEEGLFDTSFKAASVIPSPSVRSEVTNRILRMSSNLPTSSSYSADDAIS